MLFSIYITSFAEFLELKCDFSFISQASLSSCEVEMLFIIRITGFEFLELKCKLLKVSLNFLELKCDLSFMLQASSIFLAFKCDLSFVTGFVSF